MFDVVNFTLASAVADTGTVTISYPSLRQKGDYVFNNGKHKLSLNGNLLSAPADFTITFNANASNITLTNKYGSSWAAGSVGKLQLERGGAGQPDGVPGMDPTTLSRAKVGAALLTVIDLGSPNVADADGICASQSITTTGTINGALASGGVATFDVPRNVVGAWTNTAILTVTGTDEYGNTVRESSASGTSMTGKKAFKTITSVTTNASITSATVGSGDVLGLPIALPKTGLVLKELQDGATATAGTLVAADFAEATATTGDVRGTYDPNAACDGDKGFVLVAAVLNPENLGVAQFAA